MTEEDRANLVLSQMEFLTTKFLLDLMHLLRDYISKENPSSDPPR